MLEFSFRHRFEAAHRFLNASAAQYSTLHGHRWHGTLCLRFLGNNLERTSRDLNFGKLKRGWKHLLEETLDHSYLHNWKDPVATALMECQPDARCVPFPGDPTTELLSVLLFHKMELHFRAGQFRDAVKVEGIRVEGTMANHVYCGREFYEQEIKNYDAFTGWWGAESFDDRSLTAK